MAGPKICCICGYKNSGKTTLITKLVRLLTAQGFSVGTVKHDGHDFEMDHAGTDSHAHKEAGAKATAVFSDHRWAFFRDGAPSVEVLLSLMKDLDVVLIEGLKDSAYPKIVIVAEGSGPLTSPHIIALVSDEIFSTTLPLYRRDDVDALARIVLSLT